MSGNGTSNKARDVAVVPPAVDGFDGRLRCPSLADLVQLQCLSGSRAALEVTSNGRRGQLFFERGELVHASTGKLSGEEAVFEILGWSTGSFGESSEPWPTRRSITLAWQQLLMRAAQQHDEELRANPTTGDTGRSASRLVALATLRPPRAPSTLPPPGTVPPPARSSAPPPKPKAIAERARAARIDAHGNVLAQYGDCSELVDLCAYLKRLIVLLAGDLGLEGFRELQWQRAASRLALYVDAPDSYLALEAPLGTDMDALRQSLGL